MLFVYTGVAAFFTDRNPSANQIQKVLDSACAPNHITNTSPMIANPPRMMLKIMPGDSVSADLDLAEWELLNDAWPKLKTADFTPHEIEAGR